MTISTQNEPESEHIIEARRGGLFADILTVIRAILTPVIMLIIIKGWPHVGYAILASSLFIFAALTDIFDDYFGGAETAPHRGLGWFDDIADMVLVIGTLLAMCWVIHQVGWLNWMIAVPVTIFIAKEIIVGILRGFELSKLNPMEDKLATAKNAISMLAISVMLASPWLTAWFDSFRAGDDPTAIYNEASPLIWLIGMGLLWIAAIISIFHGLHLLKVTAHVKKH